MKAMVLRAQGAAEIHPLRLEDLKVPEPHRGEIRIRVLACGVCHTDLHIVEGDLPLVRRPLVPGHQVVGEVEALGPGVDRFRVGDRVGVAWLGQACQTCHFCQQGQENLCPQARFTGYHVHGGFAEYLVAQGEFVYPLPQKRPPEEIAPWLCAGIIGYRALRLSGAQRGQRLGLYGFGASAHLAIQWATDQGMEVLVFTRSPAHRELARELGAGWVGGPQEAPPEPLDAALVFAPAGWIVPHALRAVRPGGAVVLAGIHMTPIPELPYNLLHGERVLRSVAHATRRDGEEFLAWAGRAPLRREVEVYPLAQANTVLARLKQGKVQGAAVLDVRG